MPKETDADSGYDFRIEDGRFIKTILMLTALLVAACDTGPDKTASIATPQQQAATELAQAVPDQQGAQVKNSPPRPADFSKVMNGARLYAKNCAQCHGPRAEGVLHWRQRDVNGNFPPPPLNGTAHAWHHPRKQLAYTIKTGGRVMPPFGSKLNDSEVSNIIDWMVSLWPDEIYASWAVRNDQLEKRPR